MSNVTMSIDSHLLSKARRVALDRHTSVNAMVREFLEKMTIEEDRKIEKQISAFRLAIKKYSVQGCPVTWKRDELYER